MLSRLFDEHIQSDSQALENAWLFFVTNVLPVSSIDKGAMSLLSKRKQRNGKDSKSIGKMVCLLAPTGGCREIDRHEDDWI